MLKKIFIIMMALLVVASIAVKLIRINDPYFGAHLFRQLQTMSTIDNYVQNGVDLLNPKTNYIGWPGKLILEFPIYQAAVAWISDFTHQSLITARVLNILIGTFSAILVYRLALVWFAPTAALYSAVFFLFSPLNIMFHRSSLVDVLSVFFSLWSCLILFQWFKDRKFFWLVYLFLTSSLSIVIKPLYFFPVMIFAMYRLCFEGFKPLAFSVMAKTWLKYINLIVCFIAVLSILTAWLMYGQTHSTGVKVLGHMAGAEQFSFSYLLNLCLRLITQYLNPFTLVLFILGIISLFRLSKNPETRLLVIIPCLYYLIFGKINAPHAYYSLMMIPFFCWVAGEGAYQLEESFLKARIIKQREGLRIMLCVFSAVVSIWMFFMNCATTMILPDARYKHIENELKTVLVPGQYAVVYINQEGQFKDWEYLRNRPTVYLKYFMKDISEEERNSVSHDSPFIRSAMMYAIKQYGHMNYVQPSFKISISNLQTEYNHELKYVLFYAFNNQNDIKISMQPYRMIYESKDWIVYQLN